MTEKFEAGKGKAKEALGDATDNRRLEREGKGDQASAKAKSFLETVKDRLSSIIDSIRDRSSRR